MKIADLAIGELYDITLVVKAVTARETRAKKPYLALELFDGTDTISANYWDWTTNNIPPVNAILDIRAQVSEWQGIKQLTIKTMTTNTTRHLAEFVPASSADIPGTYKAAYTLMSDVKDDTLRELALGILEELRERWVTVPGAVTMHHAYMGGTLIHSYSVARIAGAIAKEMPDASYDLAVVGAMLHDIGKLFTYEIDGIAIDMTDEGKIYDHVFIGAEFVGNYAENHVDTDNAATAMKVALLRHIILSHHGKLEFGSPVLPQCIEAHIVSCADGIDAAAEQVRSAGNKAQNTCWTERIYGLGNRAQINPKYIEKVLAGEVE